MFRNPIEIHAKKGYWVYSQRTVHIALNGTAPTVDVNLEAGWNLLGPINDGVQISEFSDITADVRNWVWSWETVNYQKTSILLPTKGYWIFSDKAALISLAR